MCGRFLVSYTYQELLSYLSDVYAIEDPAIDEGFPRYNIAPTQNVVAVLFDGTRYRAGMLRWGLVPHWAKDQGIGAKLINARSETVREKPAFRDSVRTKRCVILADGFYEWKRTTTGKQPMLIRRTDERLYAMAGLWSVNRNVAKTPLYTATILTTSANALMADIHERMPVILTEEDAMRWLDPATDSDALTDLMVPYAKDDLSAIPISNRVNNVSNDSIENIRPLS
jgi:putative SOS response-associated peptidase YedK